MKTFLIFAMFSVTLFANYELENKILKDKLSIVQNYRNGSSVVADVFSADAHMEVLTNKENNYLHELN